MSIKGSKYEEIPTGTAASDSNEQQAKALSSNSPTQTLYDEFAIL